MKTIAVFVALVAVALAAPQRDQEVYVVTETPSTNIGVDGYDFGYQLSDGQTRQESAQVDARSAEDVILRVSGSYSWVDPVDGQTYTVTYIADENGFQPQGAHIPSAA